MIKIKNVFKSYKGKEVLSDFNLHIKKNEVIGLLGNSGSGKTTVLGLVSGLVAPDSGSVNVKSSHIAYIFQEHRLLPWRTALENVAFSLCAFGLTKKKAEKKASSFLEKVELSGYENYFPSQLSGGMCQRVSIARAFASKPEILLMDEPFSALDPELKKRMNRMILDLLKDSPATVIYVTHNKEELKGLADNVLRIYKKGIIKNRSI